MKHVLLAVFLMGFASASAFANSEAEYRGPGYNTYTGVSAPNDNNGSEGPNTPMPGSGVVQPVGGCTDAAGWPLPQCIPGNG